MDPRLESIGLRLSNVSRVIAVTGGKGGIGKSLVSSSLALGLAAGGAGTGLLDLDLTGPCDHIILGARGLFPNEEFGLEPPLVGKVKFMSVSYFTGEKPAPLRGNEVSNALIELLAITQWGALDYLVIDMPPGLGDATLEAARLLPRAEYLVVSTESRVVVETVRLTLQFLAGIGASVLGVVDNMVSGTAVRTAALAVEFGLPLLAELPFDADIEDRIGRFDRLLAGSFGGAVQHLANVVRGGQLDIAER